MVESSTRRNIIRALGGSTVLALAGCLGGGDDDNSTGNGGDSSDDSGTDNGMDSDSATFTVRIENTAPTDFYSSDAATGGQIWLTPGAWAVHTDENPIFTQGESASIGLEALAEAGPPTGFEGEPGLVDELPDAEGVVSTGAYTPENTVADPNDPMGEVPGAPPIAPGGAFEFEVEAEPGQRLSVASMYVPSNDQFISPASGLELYSGEDPVNGELPGDLRLWDAGTEVNGSPVTDPTGAPRQGNNGGPTAGATEGVVYRASAINDAYDYADVSEILQVTLTPE